MADQVWRTLVLRNGMPLDEAARHLSALHLAKEALTAEEQTLLGIAEGLLDLVRVGAAVYMDSEAIEADLYETAGEDADTSGRPDHRGEQRGEQKSPRPTDALQAVDPDALQAVFDRYQIVDVLVSGQRASDTDEPGDVLDLLFSHPENFSGFTMVDLADDLEALLGVTVNLVSNHPINRGWLMDQYRAAAVPLDDLLDHLGRPAPVDPGEAAATQPPPFEDGPLDNADIQARIDALDLPAEFTARQQWWSEWDPDRGTVNRFTLDPDIGDIDALLAMLRQHHAEGHTIEICSYS